MALGGVVTKRVSAVAVVAGTPQAVWTPAAGKRFRLCGWSLGVGAAASIIFKEGAGNADIGGGVQTPVLPINGVDAQPGIWPGILSAAADNVLKVDVSANATVSGYVWGFEE